MKNGQQIAVITPNSDTFTNPTMPLIFRQLQERGIIVYLFGPKQVPGCPDNLTNVMFIESGFRLSLFRNPGYYISQFLSFITVFRILRKNGIKILLGVDPLGLIYAGRIKKLFGKKLHLGYLSFEIFFKNELKSKYHLKLKEKEIYYSSTIESLLVQDEKRKELLIKENGIRISSDHIAFVPVSPEKIEVKNKVDIHEKFSIPRNKRLAVYSGSIGKWCGTQAIIEAFDKGFWDSEHWLIFHTRKPITKTDPFYEDLKRLHNDSEVPFSLHTQPFKGFEELSSFLSGFDLALALYYPNTENPYYGMNMKEIGLSSGKFSTYMMLGLPTIVTSCSIYEELLKSYKIGAIIENVESLKSAMTETKFSVEDISQLYNDYLNPLPGILSYLNIIYPE